jgi:hypothetical protein
LDRIKGIGSGTQSAPEEKIEQEEAARIKNNIN